MRPDKGCSLDGPRRTLRALEANPIAATVSRHFPEESSKQERKKKSGTRQVVSGVIGDPEKKLTRQKETEKVEKENIRGCFSANIKLGRKKKKALDTDLRSNVLAAALCISKCRQQYGAIGATDVRVYAQPFRSGPNASYLSL